MNQIQKLWHKGKIYHKDVENLDYSHLDESIVHPRQIIWHLYYGISDIPKCKNKKCNNNVKWQKSRPIYTDFCSTTCGYESDERKEKIRQTNLERYGVENPNQSKEIQNKTKKTNLERYGVENPNQSKEIREKTKQTNLERYGVESPLQSKEIQEKIKQTNLER